MAVSADGIGTLPRLLGSQARASAPGAHVWLSASAGTGKTQVLTARVYRLLLRGVDPGAILCLTFTKAGAAEMAARISARLAAWVRMPERRVKDDLAALGENPLDPGLVARARTLFAKVLDAPGGGIRIQTIHGFAQSLLSAFPIEAGLVPGFRPLEAREEAVLAREALAEMLVDAEREGRGHVIDTIGALSLRLGEGGAEGFLIACARARAGLSALPKGGIAPFVRRALDLPAGDIEAALVAACDDDAFDLASLAAVAAMNAAWGTKNGLARADTIAAWRARSSEDRAATLDELHLVWAKADGEMRSFGKGQAPQEEGYAEAASRLHEACAALVSMRTRAAYADLLAAGLEIGLDYAERYALAKRRAGAVDFDDLIGRAVALLEQPGMGEWVRYKLDQATEHILIDEAQDTNLAQWTIIGKLAEEFFAGEGRHGDRVRTLFTVGDFKQAIFGFQGTDPLNFAWAGRYFERLAGEGFDPLAGEGVPFERLSLTQSFRSTRPVLEFVDAAIATVGAAALGEIGEVEVHASEVPGPGRVTLWPAVSDDVGDPEEDEEGWVGDATRALAGKIARSVRDMINSGTLASKGRPIRPEDVLILVKRRGELASLLVARLYAEGVPVAGVDRLRLNTPLAVQDLLAAVRFALQPEDDLALASLLVSPLIGWTQDDLMHAAAPRPSRMPLWRHLRATQPAERLAPLEAMLNRADIATPYQFLEELLTGPLDGRRKLIRRLGQEARDPIEELLSAALDFETLSAPSLQLFLDWFDRGDVEIVRDPSAPLDAVRVMTAHGAKGLQAPVVILADATADPASVRRDILSWKPEDARDAIPIFRPRTIERGGEIADLAATSEARELEEHWRLFYVAATRAEEQLVIAGALGPRAKGVPPEASWYAAADRALTALGVPLVEDEARCFEGHVPQQAIATKAGEAPGAAARPDLPDWARRAAPQEARPPRPLAPSALGEDDVADPPPSPAMRAAAERGRLIHALFERLPPVPPADRAAAADRWLRDVGQVADPHARDALVATVCAVLDDPRFAALFGPDALAEAPVTAVIGDGLVVAGTIDRLLVTDDAVELIDFKTGRRVPATVDDVPIYHLRQMAAYAEALRVIFPDRRIGATLLYTAGPVSFALPDALLAAHKPRLPPAQQSLAAGA
ncbi:double-strand break repair helicase AddA [Hephaestia sp. GCM10023244]|uniref:double-strand break repair helicase AddA n=1 Tax=unclassified Hephaestia TaxID=2631281 RepID=UPI002077388B|nr:double-strand break repair helicase AddA [Hephaestia sp. MAHUQ-44]MCM8731461.1 double-strand break repair helicase AddA [Hephaestia sp. MAHUQ-44]